MLVDLHHHLVFGVDDGAPNSKASIAMLRVAAAQGVQKIVCTSHDSPGESDLNTKRYFSHLKRLRQIAADEGIPVTLYSGSEILYSPETVQALRDGRVLTLADSKHVLVEFYPDFPWPLMRRAAEDIASAGFHMVLAHAERYGCLQDLNLLTSLRRELGVRVQLNADAILHSGSLFHGRWVRQALKQELVDIVASDAHAASGRACRLADAHAFLARKYSPNFADKLCRDIPLSLIAARKERMAKHE